MNDIMIFNNPEFGEVRTVMIDSEPWFVGNDVSKALGYAKPKGAIQNHVEVDDKKVAPIQGPLGIQQTMIINESGLYSLIFGSKLESAKKFKRWVTSEVLPTLRKTGGYNLTLTTEQQIQIIAKGYTEVREEIAGVRNDLEDLKANLPLLPVEADVVSKTAKSKSVTLLGGKKAKAYKDRHIRQTVYRNMYLDINRNFDVHSYKAIKRKDYEKAIEMIEEWKPPVYLADKIAICNLSA